MIKSLYIVRAKGTNPYENLALETCLIENAREECVVMYLWQNRRSVVIGRNQNAWGECNVDALERDGGFLARRTSGGGAVFHDLGNLNFSFVAVGDDYDVERQLGVLIEAAGSLGIRAEKSGRNDVLADGRKFSGNAFSHNKNKHCHHGTIMVDVDTANLSRYLNVSALKLQSKGVRSVKSRVCNLCDLRAGTTVEEIAGAMTAAFDRVYGIKAQPLPADMIAGARLAELEELYASWEWRLGRRMPFSTELRKRLSWGEVTLQFDVDEGIVREARCFTDALDTESIEGVSEALTGCKYIGGDLALAVCSIADKAPARADIIRELADWLCME